MNRVAVVPFGFGLGDTVNMRPLLEAIGRWRSNSNVYALCPQEYEALLPVGIKALSHLAHVPLWQRPGRNSGARMIAPLATPGVIGPVIRRLPRARFAMQISRVLHREGFDEVINLLGAFGRLDLDTLWTPGPWSSDARHLIDLMSQTLIDKGIDVPSESRSPIMPYPRVKYSTSTCMVLNPNSGSSLKEAPLDLWVEVARELLVNGYEPLVLVGTNPELARELGARQPRLRLISTPNLRTLIELLRGADMVVSPDTGVLHLAAALKAPYVGLFGSTNPKFLGPYGATDRDIVVSRAAHGDVCRVCWTAQLLPLARCAQGYVPSCLQMLRASDILDRVFLKLDEAAASSSRLAPTALSS